MELQARAGVAGSATTNRPRTQTVGRATSARWAILALCLGAALLRALASVIFPNVVWADETFQAPEQALRLLTGRGMIPWEYQIGARSWLLPGVALAPMALGRAVSSDPRVAFALITALMTVVSAVNVWSAYVVGARVGRLHGLFAAGLAAGWCELVYYSPHLLPDTLSGALLLGALAVATRPERPGRLVWAGVLLGACFVVRIQLAPAVGLAALIACRTDFRTRLLPLAVGFALPVAALGLLDEWTWGAPFRSVWVYVQTNLGGVASSFGVDPPLAYVGTERAIWGVAAPLVVATAVLGARRAPGLAAITALIAITFSLVPHKEARFIYPALLMLFVVCGMGSAELAEDLGSLGRAGPARRLAAPALALVWAALSLAAGLGPAMRPAWTHDAGVLKALAVVNADPRSCGVGLAPAAWWEIGLSRLRDDLQLYDARQTPARAYDYLLRLPGPQPSLGAEAAQGFAPVGCYGPAGVCLYRRPGPCSGGDRPLRAVSSPEVRAALQRLGYGVE